MSAPHNHGIAEVSTAAKDYITPVQAELG